MIINFVLPDLPTPRLTEAILRGPSKTLTEISDRNRLRFKQGNETGAFRNRKDELIRQLKNRNNTVKSFDQATDVLGRERLLLSIYMDHLGQQGRQNWLPDFDNKIAKSILGDDGRSWHGGRRRQVTLLYFTHFDNIAALSFLCSRLIEAFSNTVFNETEQMWPWHEHNKLVFDPTGPENIATRLKVGEDISKLMSRFAIPNQGRFTEQLRQHILLNKIKKVAFGESLPDFTEIEKHKNERVSGNLFVGSAALKIMIQRVVQEGRGKWQGDWSNWIIRFGCDPRYGRSSAEGAKWWEWATDSEFRLAQQGVTGLTLRFFIEFLRKSLIGTPNERQFVHRSQFLLALFEADKICNARMVLNSYTLQHLPKEFRDRGTVALLKGAIDQTSMICLKCRDDVYIIEGTHNFRLRMFHRQFPIKDFWDLPCDSYQNQALRISPNKCPVSLVHGYSGSWIYKFFNELSEKFHIYWNDVDI